MREPHLMPSWPRAMRVELAALYVGLSEGMLVLEEKAGRFPKRVNLSPGRIIWLKEDLDLWLDEKAGRVNSVGAAASHISAGRPELSDWDRKLGGQSRAP